MLGTRDETALALSERLSRNPGDRQAYHDLCAHYRTVGDVASLVNLVAGWAGFTQDPRERSAAYAEVAELVWSGLNQPQQAADYYRAALQQDAGNAHAADSLSSLLESTGQIAELTQWLQERAEQLRRVRAAPSEQAWVQFKLGGLWSQHYGRNAEALQHFEAAIDLDPGLVQAAYEARLLCAGDAAAERRWLVLEIIAERDGERRAALVDALSDDMQRHSVPLDEQVEWLERCVERHPRDLGLLCALAGALSQRAASATGTPDDRRRAADLLHHAALSLFGEDQVSYLRAALEHDPGHSHALAALERSFSGTSHEAELPALWVSYLDTGASGPEADTRRVSLARAYLRNGQEQDARYCLEPALLARHPEAVELWNSLAPTAPEPTPEPALDHAPEPAREGESSAPPTDLALARATEGSDAAAGAPSTLPPPRRGRRRSSEAAPAESEPSPVAHSGAPASSADATAAGPPGSTEALATSDVSSDSQADTSAAGEDDQPEANPVDSERSRDTRAEEDSQALLLSDDDLLEEPVDDLEEPVDDHAERLRSLRTRVQELLGQHRRAEAAALYLDLLALDATDREAFNFLDGHYRREGDHRARCDLMVRTAEAEELPIATRVLRLREAASLLETRLKDADGAVRIWRRIHKLDPGSDEPRRNLKRLFERAQQWDELVASVEAEVAEAKSEDARIQGLKRLIALHRDQRGDLSAAADCMARILTLNPRDRGLSGQLIDTLITLGRFEDAVPWLERLVQEAPSKSQRLNQLRALASVLDEKIGDVDRAVEAYARIADMVPNDAAALRRMEELDAAAGNHRRLLQTLERRRRVASEPEAANLYVRMAELAEQQLGDADLAIEYLGQALDLAPAAEHVLDALTDLYTRTERFEELVELLRERALTERAREPRIALYRRIARTLSEHLDDEVGAATTWQGLLELREDEEALRFLEARARKADDWEQLAELLHRLARLEGGSEAATALWLERATLLLERLDRASDATGELSRLLDRAPPGHEQALHLLERACAATGQYGPLARALDKQMDRLEGPERIEVARRLSELYAQTIGDAARALTVLSRWVELSPTDPEPHRRRRDLLDPRRQPEALRDALDALGQLEAEAELRCEALVAAARLCADGLADVDGAFARLSPLAEAGAAPALDALTELATAHGRIEELCELLSRLSDHARLESVVLAAAERADNQSEKVAWLRRLARLRRDDLEDPDGAESAYVSLLELQEDEEALRYRQQCATARDDHELLAECLDRLAAIEVDPARKRDLLFELGQLLLTRLARPADATRVFQHIVNDVAPEFEPALDALVDAAEAAGDHATLATALAKRLQRADGSAERAAIAERLTDLFEGPLDNRKRAIAALRHWRTAVPHDVTPLRRLRGHLDSPEGTPGELLDVLDHLVQLEGERADQVEAAVAAATLCRDRLSDENGAWTRVIDLVPECHAGVDEVLRSLCQPSARFEELTDRLEAAGRYDTLVTRLEERIALTEEPATRALLHRRSARLLAHTLEDAERAAWHYAALLELVEDAEALRYMQTRAMAGQDAEALSDCLRRLAAIETDPNERRDLLFDHAHVLRAQLGQPQAAIEVLRRLLEEHSDFDAALDELAEACEAAGDYAGLTECLERALRREADPDAQVELARQLCDLYEERLQAPERALGCLRVWREAVPNDPEPYRRLRDLLTGADQRRERLSVLDALSEHEPDVQARHAAQLAAGELCATSLGDDAGAWRRLQPLMLAGDDRAEHLMHDVAQRQQWLPELCTLYEQTGSYDELVGALRERIDAAEPTQAVELLRHCARTLRDRLDDEQGAVEAFRELSAITNDREALEALRDAYRRQDQIEALSDVLARLASTLPEAAGRRDALLERARLLCERLERREEAIAVLRHSVRDVDPEHRESIDELVRMTELAHDHVGLAEGLNRRLALARAATDKVRCARRLADLYAGPLENPSAELSALSAWRDAAPTDPEPLRRLRPKLSGDDGPTEALLSLLDALSQLETSDEAKREAGREAARVAARSGDLEGAFLRLAPLVLADDEAAEALALETATTPEGRKRVAGLYVRRAQQQSEHGQGAVDAWRAAADMYESAGELGEALEAALRMFAADTNDAGALDRIDKLAAKARAFERIEQVYKRLVRDAPTAARQVELALRVSALVEREEGNPQAALDWALQACRAMPDSEQALSEAERLAAATDSHSDLLWLHEQRARFSQDPAVRVAYLVSAAHTADSGLGDREQANQWLADALTYTEDHPHLAGDIEDAARALDEQRPELGEQDARRALVRAHVDLAQRTGQPFGPVLMLRAAQLLRDELSDASAAYDALRQGTQTFPDDPDLLDALTRVALELERLDGLDAHLARLVKVNPDEETRIALLRRRADILSQHLKRFDSAARVYGELLELAPDDSEAAAATIDCLRRSGRFQELLKFYQRQLDRAQSQAQQAALLKAQASVWEGDLRNRRRATLAWQGVQALTPDDPEVTEALGRLQG